MVYNSHGGPDSSCSADWSFTHHSIVDDQWVDPRRGQPLKTKAACRIRRIVMKVWTKPAVREQEVGLEVTSYLPAEIDII